MKKIFLLFIVILSVNVSNAQTGWINYKIDDKLSVKLPAQPTKLDEHSVYVKTADNSVYLVAVLEYAKKEGLDSAATVTFANNFKNGMRAQFYGFILGNVNISKWKGYTCYHLDGDNTDSKLKISSFIVFIDARVYSLITIFGEKQNTQPKDDFFASLTLN